MKRILFVSHCCLVMTLSVLSLQLIICEYRKEIIRMTRFVKLSSTTRLPGIRKYETVALHGKFGTRQSEYRSRHEATPYNTASTFYLVFIIIAFTYSVIIILSVLDTRAPVSCDLIIKNNQFHILPTQTSPLGI